MADEETLRDYLKWATTNLHETRQRLRESEDRNHEPIAIVGIGCRYPGGIGDPEGFWDLLSSGSDAIGGFPTDRGWDIEGLYEQDPTGASHVREAGFMADVSGFDAGFFGISPREAVAMDPQQRLLLEVAWEALERARIDPASLRGSLTGVFAGASLSGYGFEPGTEEMDGHLMTGTGTSIISGRVAYTLGLEGPAVTIDTACSSSLVALHMAAQALRSGECTLALAGGITATVMPIMFTQFSRQLGLAQDGRSKSFSADADGMGVSEGVGMVVVERLSDAQRNGHTVLAVLRGSAINQDGASNGLTAPNGPSQQRVIRAALANARLSVADVDVVEAHGTGTPLGDPIEAQALLATYGQDRDGQAPLWLGSVKSNLGHTQAAAGIAGVIKMVLALQHQQLPRTLHSAEPSPHINWSAGEVRLLQEPVAWPAGERPRRAGISSFGISGTNAHVIVEEAPAVEAAARVIEESEPVLPGACAWVLSARSAQALTAQAARLREWVTRRPELAAAEVAWSLATTRTTFEHRAVVLGDLVAGLAAPTVTGTAGTGTRVGLVFAGQGSQWLGMGRGLYDSSPVFAATFDEVCALLETEGIAIRDLVLGGATDETLVDQTLYAQTGLFAFEVALAATLKAAGVTADAVVGHSVGEIAAAHVAGVLSLPDACRLVAARARLMQALPPGGAMAAINAPEAEVRTDDISIAAVNSPDSVVISGSEEAVERVVEHWRARGTRVRNLRVSHAFHSPAMDPALDELGQVAAGLTYEQPQTLWAGALTGEVIDQVDGSYWPAQTRQAVRFADAVATLRAQGITLFLEVGPDGSLSGLGDFVPLQKRNAPDLLGALARAFVNGAGVDWAKVLPAAAPVALPTYAFQHERYWVKVTAPDTAATGTDATKTAAEARFWAAVEGGDLAQLTGTLAVDEQRPFAEVLPALARWRRQEQDRSQTAGWRYRTSWTPVTDAHTGVLSGTWLVVTADGHSRPDVTAALTARGATVVEAGVDGLDDIGPVDGVLSLLALDESATDDFPAVPRGLAATLALVQAGIDAPLWIATSGAVAATPGEPLTNPLQAQAQGLGRVVALEHPDRWGGLIDLPAQLDERSGARLAAVLAGCGEDDVAIRPTAILGRRLAHAPQTRGTGEGWQPRGTALLTGGTGAIAGHVARWLAARGADRLVLTSRSGPAAPGAATLAAELAIAGARADVLACDASNRAELSAVITRSGPLNAVLHTAGVLDDGILGRLTPARLATVLTAKAQSAALLDDLTAGLDLDAFVLFSSSASILGAPGQGNYAAANAYLDALAENRRGRGLPALSVAWGAWAGGGLAGSNDVVRHRTQQGPMPALDPQLAVRALGEALAGAAAVVAVMDADWAQLAAAPGARRDLPLVRDLPEVRALAAVAAPDTAWSTVRGTGELAQRLTGLSRAEQERLLADLVRAEAAAVLGHSTPDAVDADRAFNDLGFDSLTAVELRNGLTAATGLRLPATLIFDYPNAVALAAFLRTELAEDLTAEPAAPAAAPTAIDAGEPLAIVGMGCRFPGGTSSPEQFWDLLASGGDAVGDLPRDRSWDLDALYDPDPDSTGTSYAAQGGFLSQASEFDAGFFGISPREALAMDPQQRLLLEVSWEALERAGIDPSSLRGSATGVFAGGYGSGYAIVSAMAGDQAAGMQGHEMTGNATSVLSGRVSYALGLEGPAVTIDTACSSSLVALHMAGQALRSGECSLALVGGVTIMATPWELLGFSQQRGLAADGRSKAFSADADGMGMAEGAGMLVVERLSDAQRHGHKVLAVVRGSALNQDGASNGLTAPNGPSQQRVIRAALTSAGLTTADVDVVEAHGTGTTLGDPIEAQALLATYGQGRDVPLWLGSVKSNIGHTQAAAGVAGIMKMVLALQHERLPRTLHADVPSPHVDWTAGSVQLLTSAQPWPASSHSASSQSASSESASSQSASSRPRRAAVSAFGISGTNAHVIIEEAPAAAASVPPAPVDMPAVSGAAAWVLSGRTDEGLAAQAGRLREWLVARPALDADDVAWSLAATRAVFEHRAVVVRSSASEASSSSPSGDAASLSVTSGLDGLVSLATGQASPSVVSGVARAGVRPVFVFPGQGSQWIGMGRELAATSPVFAARFAECQQALAPYVDVDLTASPHDQVDLIQPLLWAVMVSLAAVWEAAGVTPDAVVGHSQGEIAAATVAGMLSLDDAAKVVALRAQTLRTLSGSGGMMSVSQPAAAVEERLARFAGRVSVAAVNGPSAVVVSGEPAALDELKAEFDAAGIRARMVNVDYASHCAQVDRLEREILAVLDGITPRPGRVPMVSAMSGETLSGPELDENYWYANLRNPVYFERAVRILAEQGHDMFIECTPHPVMLGALTDTVDAAVVGTLRRDDGGVTRLVTSLAEAFVQGARVDWTKVLTTGHQVDLPTYAFQHERYWPEGLLTLPSAAAAAAAGDAPAPASEVESRFWAAIEAGDLSRLAVDGNRPFAEVLPDLTSWRREAQGRSITASWRYKVTWKPVTESGPAVLTGTWLVVRPDGDAARTGGFGDDVVAALVARGAQVIETDVHNLDGIGPVAGVLSLLALDESATVDHPAVPQGIASTLALVQAGIDAPLWIITRGAVAAGAGETLASPVQAQAWGMGRVVALEHPDRWGGLIDLPAVLDERAGARLATVLAGCGEDQVAIRSAGILGRRLVRAAQPRTTAAGWHPRGSVLITGGAGAIGGHVARHLAAAGTERLVLTGRSGPATAGAAELAAELATSGARVDLLACDVSSRAELTDLLDWSADISAVMHTAGVLDDGVLERLTPARFATVMTGKVGGAALLDEVTADLDLEAFVLFSSGAATLGAAGQANYAAANAYLDALAENRRDRGLAGLSVAWGQWRGGGLAESNDAILQRAQRTPMPPMDPDLAVRALLEALQGPDTTLTVMDVDWPQLAAAPSSRHLRDMPLVRDLSDIRRLAATATVAAAPVAEDGLAGRLGKLTTGEQERVLTDIVRGEAAIVLGHASADAIPAGQAFKDLGIDSLTAVELRNALAAITGLRLPATLVFDYPTSLAVAAYLRTELLGGRTGEVAAEAAPPAVVAAAPHHDEPMAIVGLSCRFPGGSSTPEQFWDLLAAGGDAVGGFPTDRGWDLDGLYDPDRERHGTSYVQSGAFLSDATEFDAGFFGISPREALAMDPQQRLLLEVAWEALERAGIDPATLRGSSTGVFAGAFSSSYGIGLSLASQTGNESVAGVEGHVMTGNATSVVSGRVSYALGLEGPAVTIDTACSSSLVALHLAVQALRSGECSLALAGGVTVLVSPNVFVEFSRQQGLSADGRCRAFSADADGTGWAEGAGMLVVERLSDAQRNGHKVLAVVRGSAVNQDGASNGLSAPNGPSQQRVIKAALANAQLSAADVDVVEAHGTGTTLGDPIEAQALLATYGQNRVADRPLLLGSVKSNIGHTQAAAGVAGVVKMVLAMQHEQLPQTLHADEPSPHVDWSTGDVKLLTEATPWPSGDRPRRAGVSAFGISGTNVHVIVEEAPTLPPVEAEKPAAVLPQTCAWVVSGRSAAGLAAQAGRLREWVVGRPRLDPADLAWSLATTRTAFEHRAVILDDLAAGLAGVATGQSTAISGVAATGARVGLVFAGQGSQWLGMGRTLYDHSPVFAATFDQVAGLLELDLGIPVRDVVLGDAAEELVDQTLYAQTGLFAFEVALAAVLKAAGVTFHAVVGHSVGEIAAAHVAGVLSLGDACRLVAARARLMQALPPGGAMAAINASEAQVRTDDVAIAAVNGPDSVVISGDTAAVGHVVEHWRARGTRVRNLRVSHAFHSPAMDPALDELGQVAADLDHQQPQLLWAGALTGELVTSPESSYWPAQTRHAVRFADAVSTLVAQGVSVFLEVGPDGSLSPLVDGVPMAADPSTSTLVTAVPLQKRTDVSPVSGLARAFVNGAGVDWGKVLPAASTVLLPTYAFQHERYWPEGMMTLPSQLEGRDGAEAEFWAAVDSGDLAALAGTLALPDEQASELLPALASWRRRSQDRSVTTTWRYRTTWEPVSTSAPGVLSGTWLVVRPAGVGDDVVAALAARGAEVVEADVRGLDGVGAVAGVLSLLALDESSMVDFPSVPQGLASTLELVQALGAAGITAPLWIATRGAVDAGPDEALTSPIQAQAWGLGRVVGLEHPDRWGGLIDLPPVLDDRAAARLATVLAGCNEDQVAIRPAGIFGRRLNHAPSLAGSAPSGTDSWRPRGTVLITGGTGAIGGHVARGLAERGAPRLVLTSRSGPAAAGAAELAAALAVAGARADIVACDVSRRDDVAAVITFTGELSAVMHTAGVLDDGVIERLSPSRLSTVLTAKATSAALLDELTAHRDLDAFVLFSSAASTLGSAGQGSYVAANAYLDALAENRRSRGLAALAVAWGVWSGGGFAESNEAVRKRMQHTPMPPMNPELAVRALIEALHGPDAALAIMDVNWAQMAAAPGPRDLREMPLVRDLPELRALANDPALPAVGQGELGRRLTGLGRVDQERLLTDLVRVEAAAVLGHSSAEGVPARSAFKDLGFDSLTAVELRNRLSAASGLRLSATLVFDYPTPAVLASHLRAELTGVDDAVPDAVVAAAASDEPLAIVGMSCRFPGGAGSPEQFWELLSTGGDGIGGFPSDRGWDLDGLYDPDRDSVGTSYVREGGFLAGASEFDPGFFGISPREALAMDPQQRLLLEVSWEALERAGIDPTALRGSPTGMFAGGFNSGYQLAVMLAGQVPDNSAAGVEGHLLTGNATSVLSGRVSYALGLEGPAVTVDTACSSSLVALHLAGQALRSGECSLALAGGVTVLAQPGTFVDFSRQQGLSTDGRCRAFSAEADGTGWAEGVGVLVVERLSDAQRNGHKVLAVVRGSAVNQDGASNGLTAPNGPSQQRVIKAALANARLSAADVDVVEAHGTGTTLGDPIEAQALLATYGQGRDVPLWLGSVKSNIGHTQAAAGVAGLIKMVLALQHEQLPQTLYAQEPSPHVDWSTGDIRLLSEPVVWPAGRRVRRAGVSSFGMSGTNAHIILEEAPAAAELTAAPATPIEPQPVQARAWVLSGRTAEGLAGQAGRLREWLVAHPELNPADVAWSLVTTRATFEHRAVVIDGNRDELVTIATGQSSPSVVSGVARAETRPVFVFPGQGSQWIGMGRELAEVSPVFAARFAECRQALAPYVDVDLTASEHDQVDVIQPLLWAVMVSLAAVWEAAGVHPDAVVGHSQGEIAAATVAGMLSLDDAAKVVALRSRTLRVLSGAGGMMSVQQNVTLVEERLAHFAGRVSVAAVNGPAAVVVSGEPTALEELKAELEADGIRARMVNVDYASHGPQVDQLEAEILAALESIEPVEGRVPMVSAMSGDTLSGPELDARYWFASLRNPVYFERAVRTLAEQGHDMFIEVSPHPVMMGALTDTVDATVLGTLRRDDGGTTRMVTSLAEAFVQGARVDWTTVLTASRQVDLPTYAFQHQRFWPDGVLALPTAGATPTTNTSEVEARFWAAVDGGDLTQLAVDATRPFAEILPQLASWRREEQDRSVTAGWRYRVTWKPVTESGPAVLSGTWLVIRSEGVGDDVVDALTARGAHVVVVDGCVDRAELVQALTGVGPVAGVLSLLALDESPLAEFPVVAQGVAATLALVQALGDLGVQAPLWVATRGAVAAGAGEVLTNPVQAQVWGLGRAAAFEYPDRWGGLIDLPAKLDTRSSAHLATVLNGCGEEEVAVRSAAILARRMAHAPQPRSQEWRPNGTVLITGGAGAIGGHVARRLAAEGTSRLVLTGRSGPGTTGVATLATDLATAGARVDVMACDIGSRTEVTGLLDWAPDVTAVMHTAGVIDDGVVEHLSPARLAKVMEGKVAGAALLDELTAHLDLEAFVLFSSGAATLGSAGQGNYAAANAYLDALAENRKARGLAGLSVAWGQWSGGGLAESNDAIVQRAQRTPMPPMDPDLAVRALFEALHGNDTALTVMDIDWERLAGMTSSAGGGLQNRPLVQDLPEIRALAAAPAPARTAATEEGGLAGRLSGLSQSEQEHLLTGIVRAEAAVVLGHATPDAIPAEQTFKDLGIDSLTAVELRNGLNAATGLRLPATLVFDYPTPAAIAAHLRTALAPEGSATVPVLDELGRLEAAIRTGSAGESVREELTERLRRLLDAVTASAEKSRTEREADLGAATDDELFALVDELE
ncbi:type I polyketide synthase [Actinoplanes sp. N902-109]|uniref:type I polyketide synthase n=1 Tax=Actinoplanes sp. (strain N902-109) TaxID=649831 RepID=UPI0003294226|nr:type I polyketide synthase [Actinoplanes sp. N902-109]AGL16002.1 modular polyketide synthase [Actinoplanes sp. N902-109]